MPKPFDYTNVNLDIEPRAERAAAVADLETPFRILILGDFSGRRNRGFMEEHRPLAFRRPKAVDRDNFSEVMAGFGVQLRIPAAGPEGPRLSLSFAELDDFHPDRLFQNLEIFRALKETRDRLEDADTFAETASRIKGWMRPEPVAAPEPPSPHALTGSLLDQMVEQSESEPVAAMPRRAADPLYSFVRAVLEPHLVPKADPKQAEMVAQVDKAISGQMRSILHNRDFQQIEAAWRALYFLVKELETGTQLRVFLMDVSKDELAADLRSADDLRTTAMHKILVEQTVGTPGAEPWAVVAGDYTFDLTLEDADLLSRVALLASKAGAPFLAAAAPSIVGCKSFAETPDSDDWKRLPQEIAAVWDFVREFPEANYLGLALPRFLLRLPYGAGGEAVERFEFEEMASPPRHDSYLWGNPAFFCLLLMGQAFSEFAWGMRPGIYQELRGLPVHAYKQDQESRLQHGAEALLTQKAAELILGAGLMPLLPMKDTDRVRLGRFQSVAKPYKPLAGRWAG